MRQKQIEAKQLNSQNIRYTRRAIALVGYLDLSKSKGFYLTGGGDRCRQASRQRCTTTHYMSPHTNKTLNKSRATHTGDHKQLKHTLNTTQSLRSKQKPFTKHPLKPQDLNLCAPASKPIVDPQGLNLCDPEKHKTQNTIHKPKGLNLCCLGNENPQACTNQTTGFEPVLPVAPHVKRRSLYEH